MAGTATYVGADAATQGNWLGVYGAAGYGIACGTDATTDAISSPTGATVESHTLTARFRYSGASGDAKALQYPSGVSRVSAVWYATPRLDVEITDGSTRQIAMYFWDAVDNDRALTVTVSSVTGATATTLETRNIAAGFGTVPVYLVWTCTGHVRFTVTYTAGTNAIFNGYFIDIANSVPLVSAGPDQSIVLPPGTFTLAGSMSDSDGPDAVTGLWTVTSAPPPGVVTFTDDTSPTTTGSASHHGVYVLRFTANDGEDTAYDEMTLTVGAPASGATYAIDDVPLTRVIEKIERRGVRIALALGSNWTCDLATYDNDSTAGAYRPNLRDNLSVDYEGQRLFKGPVTTRRDTPRARTNKGNICHITAKANVLVSEQLQVDDFEAAAGQTLEQIVTALHTHGSPSLADHGIALDPSMPTGPTLAEVTSFDGVTFQQAFNRLMERTGSIIRITPDDVLQAFAPGDEVCAYALTATNGLARGAVTWEESSSKFVNRVTVEFGSGTFAVTETLAADGIDYSFPLAYTYVADFETVNNDGTQEIATRQGIGFDLAVQWLFYPPAVVGDPWTLRRETTGVPDPPAAGTITVTYLAQFPMRVTVEDAASILADGLWHRKFPRPDIFDIAEATEEATGLLRVNGATPKTITVRTREYPMPLPGDVINLNFPDRLIPDDDYLITRVAAEDYVDQKFEFVLTCVEGTEPQQSWTDTLKSLIGAG
jgi:hypothetical protein